MSGEKRAREELQQEMIGRFNQKLNDSSSKRNTKQPKTTTQYNKLERKYNDLIATQNNTLLTLATFKAEEARLREENIRLTKVLEDLSTGPAKEDPNGSQKSSMGGTKDDIDSILKKKNHNLEVSNRRLQQELNRVESEVKRLTKQLSDQNHEALHLQMENSTVKRKNEYLQQQNNSLEATTKQQQRKITNLSKRGPSKNEINEVPITGNKADETKDLNISKLQGEVSNLQDTLQSSNKQITDLTMEVMHSKTANELLKLTLDRQVAQLEHNLRESGGLCEALTQRNLALQQQVNELKEIATKKEHEILIAHYAPVDHDLGSEFSLPQQTLGYNIKSEPLDEFPLPQQTIGDLNWNNLEGVAVQIAELSNSYAIWEQALVEQNEGQNELYNSIHSVHEDLVQEHQKFQEHSLLARKALANLRTHKDQFPDQAKRIQIFLEKRMIPDSEEYRDLLDSTSELAASRSKMKCFVTYSLHPDSAALQARLIKIKEDLEKAGIEMLPDIHTIEGDKATAGIQESDRVLVICTPRFKQMVEEQANSCAKQELEAALQKQLTAPKFIVPIILEGDSSTSVPSSLHHMTALNFTDRKKYCDNMVLLDPKGLIPLILGLETSRNYSQTLKGYLAPLVFTGTLKK